MLKKLTQQATDLILHSIASGEVMGANLLITKGNEELVYAQAGMADWEAEKPIERNTIFRYILVMEEFKLTVVTGLYISLIQKYVEKKGIKRGWIISVTIRPMRK